MLYWNTVAAILIQWCQRRCRGADVTKECLEKIFIFTPHYYANCVSTTLTDWIPHNVESVYLFYSNPVFCLLAISNFNAKVRCSLPRNEDSWNMKFIWGRVESDRMHMGNVGNESGICGRSHNFIDGMGKIIRDSLQQSPFQDKQ
jgi:hypothetical protein